MIEPVRTIEIGTGDCIKRFTQGIAKIKGVWIYRNQFTNLEKVL